MKVLIGIPTHKRPQLLRECLKSIERQKGKPADIEVFVADNDPKGSEGVATAESMAADYRFPLSAASVEVPGISAVRNAILDEARQRNVDFIAMIDDDETASPEWLANLLAMQRQTSADIVGGPVQFQFAEPPSETVLECRVFRPKSRPAGKSTALRGSGNFLASSRAIAAVNWPKFDHDFGLTGGGDTEWFVRLARLGISYAWAPDAVATERVPVERATEQWILNRAYRAGNSNMRFAIKHWPSMALVYNLATVILAAVSAPILAPFLFLPKHRLAILYSWRSATGRMSALRGGVVREYADRHEAGK